MTVVNSYYPTGLIFFFSSIFCFIQQEKLSFFTYQRVMSTHKQIFSCIMNVSLSNFYIFSIRSLILLSTNTFNRKRKENLPTTKTRTLNFSFFLSSNNKSLDFFFVVIFTYHLYLSVVNKHSLMLPKSNVPVNDEKKVCNNVSI
jgi:hypothetical protein